jgi:outer membrane protein insertion porin family
MNYGEASISWCWKLVLSPLLYLATTNFQLNQANFMRVSSAAILTLASVSAGNFSEPATAAPSNTSTAKNTNSIIVPVITESPARLETIARPETENAPQFSQNLLGVQSPSSNNSAVVIKTIQPAITKDTPPSNTPTQKAPIQIPVPSIASLTPTKPKTSQKEPIQIPVPSIASLTPTKPKTSQKEPIQIPVPSIASLTPTKPKTSQKEPIQIPVPPAVSRTAAKPVTPITTPTLPSSTSPTPTTFPSQTDPNLVVPATEVQIVGASQELQQIIRQVIKTQAGGDTSQAQIEKDVAEILNTKLFLSARVNSTNTPNGLKVVYQVQPIVVRSLQLSGAKVLTYKVATEPFQGQINQAISPSGLQESVQKINKWYKDNGILTVNVAEGLVSDIKFKFLNENGEAVDGQSKPVVGRTKPDFLRQQLKLKPGEIFKEDIVRQDVMRLYGLGLFESVNVTLDGDATKTDVVYEIKETGARSVNVGGNYNADQGILGTFNYQDRNVGGINDTLSTNVQLGRRDLLFDTTFNSPYRLTDPNRNGYTINAFRKSGLSETFDGDDIKFANGDRIRESKIGASVSFQRPIEGWDASLGFNYARVNIRDRDGKITPTDAQGNPLSLSGTGTDDLATVSLSAVKDRRDNKINPTSGSILKLSTEQSIPLGNSGITMNRLQANYSQFVPVQVYKSQQPQVFAVNLQAGTVLGDLAPYETFNLGGQNSVRGYGMGDVGSARTYVLASAEYRFPLLKSLGGVLFADYASDLGSGDNVIGNPAGVRGKPGSGFGYGAGIRLDSPLGLLRADYGVTDQGESRFNFGIGQKF